MLTLSPTWCPMSRYVLLQLQLTIQLSRNLLLTPTLESTKSSLCQRSRVIITKKNINKLWEIPKLFIPHKHQHKWTMIAHRNSFNSMHHVEDERSAHPVLWALKTGLNCTRLNSNCSNNPSCAIIVSGHIFVLVPKETTSAVHPPSTHWPHILTMYIDLLERKGFLNVTSCVAWVVAFSLNNKSTHNSIHLATRILDTVIANVNFALALNYATPLSPLVPLT